MISLDGNMLWQSGQSARFTKGISVSCFLPDVGVFYICPTILSVLSKSHAYVRFKNFWWDFSFKGGESFMFSDHIVWLCSQFVFGRNQMVFYVLLDKGASQNPFVNIKKDNIPTDCVCFSGSESLLIQFFLSKKKFSNQDFWLCM